MNEEKKAKNRTRWLGIIAVVAVVALVVTYAKVRKVNVPGELVGTWRADEKEHAEHPFEISYSTVNFGTAAGAVSTGFIKDVRSEEQDGKTLYTIFYSVDGTDEQVSFYYAGDHTIRFKGQEKVVWKKDEGS
jgi:hypothetical protein